MKQRLLLSIFSGLLILGALSVYAPPARAQLFGESDEEKAARQKHEDGQDAKISQLAERVSNLEQRVNNLEQSLSRTIGTNEMLQHRLSELNRKLERQKKDFAYRLCTLSAQQLGEDPDSGGLNCAAAAASGSDSTSGSSSFSSSSSSFAAPSDSGSVSSPVTEAEQGQNSLPPLQNPAQSANGGPRKPAPGPGILGTLPAGTPLPRPGPAGSASAPAAPAPAADHQQYDAAMNLLARAQYDQAQTAFRAFADGHPDDPLAGQAIYWVGNIDYVRKDYSDAAHTFAEAIKKYPKGARAPDSMLKLGQSLLAMGQKRGGCTALAALKSKYPHAPGATLAAAADAHKVSCR
jgi:tol-pal system protein YbgF